MTVYYGSDVANGTIGTACTMSTTTGGTEVTKTSTWSGGNHFAEVWSQSGSSTPVTAIPATPTGHGWVTAAPGAGSFANANWSASIALALSSSATVSWTVRFFKYSSGTYTSIGTIATSAASLGTSRTVISFAATSMPLTTFAAGDLLYVDLWMQDTTGAGGDNAIVYESNSSSAGVTSDVQITTSTFTPSSNTFSRTVPATVALKSTLSRTVPSTIALKSTGLARTVPATVALKSTGLARTVPAHAALANTHSRTVPATIALDQPSSRTIPATIALKGTLSRTVPATIALKSTGLARTIPATVALKSTLSRTVPAHVALTNTGSRTVPATVALKSTGLARTVPAHAALTNRISRTIPATVAVSVTSHRTIPASAALTIEIASGGFGVFASGPNTATFDHMRFTQYPDPALSLAPVLPRLGSTTVAWDEAAQPSGSRTIQTSLDGVNWTAIPAPTAMRFDGTSGYISLPTTGLPTGAAAWSMECWAQMPTPLPTSGSGFNTTMSMGTPGVSNEFAYIYYRTTAAAFRIDVVSTSIQSSAVVAGGVYHLVATYDGTTLRFYLDSILQGSATVTLNITASIAQIGNDNSGDFWAGVMQACSIYSTALSATQISANYNAGLAANMYNATVLAIVPAPLRFYPLNDASSTVVDSGSQAQNGTTHGTIIENVPGLIATTTYHSANIPGLTGQPDATIDTFNSNTSANYTNTSKSGGSAATTTYETANSRLTLSGGSGGLYLYNAITDNDVDLIADMDESDAGGLVWRFVDTNNYYELGAYDDSSSGGFTNQLRLYKVVAGTRSLIGSASTISWPRSTPGTSPYKRLRITMLGSTITVYFDGTSVQTATDATFTSGKMGLRNDGGSSRYYQLRLLAVGDYVSGSPQGDIVTGDFVYTQVTLSTTDPTVNPQIQDLTTTANSPSVANGAIISQLHDPTKPFASFYNAEMDSLAQSSGDFYWGVINNALTFAARQAVPAPWILYSTDLLFNPIVKPTFSADLYRNRQIITNCLGTVNVSNEQKIADGTATSWQMAYPLYSAPTISVQGVSKTVALQGGAIVADFYWQPASTSISQDAAAAVIPKGYIIDASYVGQFTTNVTRDNLAEQAARQAVEGGTGIVEAIEDGKQMLVSAAQTHADGLLARNANNNTVEIVVTTRRAGAQKGQALPVFIPEHSINNAQLLVTKVIATGEQLADGTILYEYQITATNGPNLSKWSTALNS